MAEPFRAGSGERSYGSGDRPYGSGGPRGRALEVAVDERGVESALRAFKRLVMRDGILRDFTRKSRYEKPGERREGVAPGSPSRAGGAKGGVPARFRSCH